MEYQRNGNAVLVRLDKGEEILHSLNQLCIKEGIRSGFINGFGAVDQAALGIFRTARKKYESADFTGEYEIASLTGTISTLDNSPYLHIHMTITDPVQGLLHGGHLGSARISATAEIGITILEIPATRHFDESIGLQLLTFSGSDQ